MTKNCLKNFKKAIFGASAFYPLGPLSYRNQEKSNLQMFLILVEIGVTFFCNHKHNTNTENMLIYRVFEIFG